jgi:hypothetical protein
LSIAAAVVTGGAVLAAGIMIGGHSTPPRNTTTRPVDATTPPVNATAGAPAAAVTAAPAEPAQPPAAATQASGEPTLGAPGAFQDGSGFGQARPRRVFYGGDPTGDIRAITWRTWGGPTAIGTGIGYYEPDNAPVAESYSQPAQIKAYDLGLCHGKRVYLKVQWWYPSHGGSFDPGESGYNLCTGP